MQQTRLDRWLRERFSLETHVFTFAPPPRVPRRAKVHSLEVTPRSRYRHKFVLRHPKDINDLFASLRETNQTFTTQIVARTGFLARLFNHPGGKSFTYRVFWAMFLAISITLAVYFIPWLKLWHSLSEAYAFISQYF